MDMKKFVLGFVVGLITSMVVGVFAANSDIFTAQRATFDIYVADEKFQPENPALVVEGRTYLPLRATGEALGIEVIWNGDLRRVEINKDNTDGKGVDSDMQKQSNANREAKSGEIFREVKQRGSTVCVKEIGGEQYATPTVFGQDCVRYDGDKTYIVIPGREPVLVKVGDELTEHATKDFYSGIIIKLSSLGLEADVKDGMITVRYK
jgi:hypothetical protein